MSEKEHLKIMYSWLVQATLVTIVWFPLFAWLFTLCFDVVDFIMGFVVIYGSVRQIYFVLISRFALITCGKLVFTFSRGTGAVVVYVLREWLKK